MKNLLFAIRRNYTYCVKPKWLYWISLIVVPLLVTGFLYIIILAITQQPNRIDSIDKFLMVVLMTFGWLGTLMQMHSHFVSKGLILKMKQNKAERERLKCEYIDNVFNKDSNLLKTFWEIPNSKKEEFLDIMFEREQLKTKKEDGELNGN